MIQTVGPPRQGAEFCLYRGPPTRWVTWGDTAAFQSQEALGHMQRQVVQSDRVADV